MSDIYNEIEQEMRRDQALKLWSKYQVPLYVLAALVLVGLGVWRFWQNRVLEQQQAQGAAYAAALKLGQDGKTDDARKALDAMAKGQGGYALLARLSSADDLSSHDALAGAAAFDAIAADPSVSPLLRDLARLRAAFLHMNDKNPAEAHRRLQDIAGPGDPFHASAREQLAILGLARKDYKDAGKWLDMIVSDPAAPAAIRSRAESLQGLIASAGSLPPPMVRTLPAGPAAFMQVPPNLTAPDASTPAASTPGGSTLGGSPPAAPAPAAPAAKAGKP